MLDQTTRAFLDAPNFAAVTTMLPSGQPMTQIMWVDHDGDHVLVNTEVGRQKFANVQHDPRVTLAVWDASNPHRYTEIRGRVVSTITGTEAREHIDRLSLKYNGAPYANPIETERVILEIEPTRVRSQT